MKTNLSIQTLLSHETIWNFIGTTNHFNENKIALEKNKSQSSDAAKIAKIWRVLRSFRLSDEFFMSFRTINKRTFMKSKSEPVKIQTKLLK